MLKNMPYKLNNHRLRLTSMLCIIVLGLSSCVNTSDSAAELEDLQWIYLLDENLSKWEKWMGVPHTSVTGLPANTFIADDLNHHGNPTDAMGLDADLKQVFSMQKIDGKDVLHVTGEIYGGLTTKAEFENYHMSLEVKWGDQKWAPRLTAKRDSGLLFHCKGPHGAFWRVWKACQELQIQESDFGDYIPLAGPTGKIRSSAKRDNSFIYDLNSKDYGQVWGYSHALLEPDKPHGQWNTVELYAFNDYAIFIVNDVVVMVVTESTGKDGKPLTSGQLQLQSEGAEVFFRDIKIRNITAVPKDILIQAKV